MYTSPSEKNSSITTQALIEKNLVYQLQQSSNSRNAFSHNLITPTIIEGTRAAAHLLTWSRDFHFFTCAFEK
jgi:hypothetical protein